MNSVDQRFMRRALDLAARGTARVLPNPRVGAVVVRDGRVVGEGFHRAYGGPHAEVFGLRAAGTRAKGATLYVTLEPCSPHAKKTPPCSELVARSGVKRVVVAMKDPNPSVNGRGLARLRRARIKVACGILANSARELNEPFIKAHTRGLPYVVAKWAMTLDGKIATRTGDSKWISSALSRASAKRARDEFQAILVGSRTALRDNPMLRGARTRPVRVVPDTTAQTSLASNLVRTARRHPTWIFCSTSAPAKRIRALRERGVKVFQLEAMDLRVLLERLAIESIHKVLVEGGGEVHASLFEDRLVDEVCVFVAPKISGGRGAATPVGGDGIAKMARARRLKDVTVDRLGGDIVVRARVGS